MITSLPIDLLIRIKNGYRSGKKAIVAPLSNFNSSILDLLVKSHLINSFSVSKTNPKVVDVFLNYQDGLPAIEEIKIFSKPGRRLYQKVSSLPWGQTPNSLIIVSTSQGLMSQRQAKLKNLGGEIIAEIY